MRASMIAARFWHEISLGAFALRPGVVMNLSGWAFSRIAPP